MTDRSRRPVRHANQLAQPVEAMIVRLKKEKPHWGARKIRELLARAIDPPPGNIVLWRGISGLTDFTLGATIGTELVDSWMPAMYFDAAFDPTKRAEH